MVKMIVTDLDNTLLKTDKTISDYTKSVLERCRNIGIKVVYATARGGSAEQLLQNALFDGRITMNGAIAKIDDKIVYSRLIPYSSARPLLITCHNRGLKTAVETSNKYYTNFNITDEWADITNFEITDFTALNMTIEKIFFVGLSPEDEDYINSILPDMLYLKMARTSEKNGFGMAMHCDATKASASAELARIWGITQLEIAAFGDDLNDIDLLRYCGTGVVVENGLEEAKAAADEICGSNENDVIARWLEDRIALNNTIKYNATEGN